MKSGIRHPFFRPSWRRHLTVALTLGWALMELLVFGQPVWALAFAAIGFYCCYEFYVVFDPANYEDHDG